MAEAIHPGETLREDMEALGMSAAELARRDPCAREPDHGNTQRAPCHHRRHGASPGAIFRYIGRVLAQPAEAV